MKKIFNFLTSLALVMGVFSFVGMSSVAEAATTSNLPANAQGTYTQWDLGFLNPGNKITAVSTNDGDTTAVWDGDNNTVQTYVVENAGVPAGSTINSVTLYAVAKRVLSAKFALGVENGGAFDEGSDITPTTSYATYSRVMATNPLTALPWTDAEVNSWTTRFGFSRTNAAGYIGVTQMYVVVDYTAPVCGDGIVNGTDECDDDNEVNGDGCENDCTFTCTIDAECTNGAFCDGAEICNLETHTCVAGTSVTVDDENACTADSCDEESDTIVHTSIDTDLDTIADCNDNCPAISNVDQTDTNDNGIGDACEVATCGNGELEEEACDDGNTTDGDGCSEVCTIEDGYTCDDAEPSVCTPVVVDDACGSLTLYVDGEDPQDIEFDGGVWSHTYTDGNDREVTVTDLGGGDYKVEYDIVSGPALTFTSIEGSIVVNGGATMVSVDTTYPLLAGLEPAYLQWGVADAVSLVPTTSVSFDLRTTKFSKDTFGFSVSECPQGCEPSNGGVEICDGIDNNCNESIDEGTDVVVGCNVGVGMCQTEGTITTTCVAGLPVEGTCTAEAGTPSEEVCDEVDNDCDGSINEDLICVPEVCTETTGPTPYIVMALDHSFDHVGVTGTPLATVTVAVGDELTITAAADDTWSAGDSDDPYDRESNANGLDAYGLYGDFKHGSLVGRINGGSWFFVGTSYGPTVVSEAGTLELAYWDSFSEDNTGEVTANITVETVVECPEEAYCGDGIVNNDEECDDGLILYTVFSEEVSPTYCNDECELVEFPTCGDGEVNQEGEQCDDGNENNNDSCSNTCQNNGGGGGGAPSSIGPNDGPGGAPETLLETGPTPATAETVHQACDEDTYILDRLKKLSRETFSVVHSIPSMYAMMIGPKAIQLSTRMMARLRNETDPEKRNDLIRSLVCKIEILKEKNGVRHQNIGYETKGPAEDYLLQYLQDLAILEFTK